MRFRCLFLALLLCVCPVLADERVRVVATIPDLADFARQLGGDRTEVKSLLTGTEDVHTYEPRISDVKSVASAHVLVSVGLGLEEWLHGLRQNAGNKKLLSVETSKGAALIREEAHGRTHRHGHGTVNPHIWLDPANAAVMCRNLAAALEAADPGGASYYRRRLETYLGQLDAARTELRKVVAGLEDRRLLSYHPAWPYLAHGFGFHLAGVVAEDPSQEPSAKAIARLISRIRAEKLRVLITEPQLPSKIPNLLAQETGIRLVTLSDLAGYDGKRTYLENMERNVRAIVAALSAADR